MRFQCWAIFELFGTQGLTLRTYDYFATIESKSMEEIAINDRKTTRSGFRLRGWPQNKRRSKSIVKSNEGHQQLWTKVPMGLNRTGVFNQHIFLNWFTTHSGLLCCQQCSWVVWDVWDSSSHSSEKLSQSVYTRMQYPLRRTAQQALN